MKDQFCSKTDCEDREESSLAGWLNNSWVRTIISAAFIGGTCIASFNIKIEGMEDDLISIRSDLRYLKAEQVKDTQFRESGERFNQKDGAQLEIRNRDYTDKKISEALDGIWRELQRLNQANTK